MLYQTYDAHFWGLTPARLTARALHHTLSHPYSPVSYTPVGRVGAAMAEMFDRWARRYHKPSFDIEAVATGKRDIAVHQESVLDKPFCSLLHFRKETERDLKQPKLLLVAPMSGHYATLLRGTTETVLPDHDTYITDWADARMVPLSKGNFDFSDYVDYVIEFLRFLGPNTHVVAVCQPSPAVLAATALLAQAKDEAQPASVTLMGGPIDTRINPTGVNKLASSEELSWFEYKAIHVVPSYYPGAMRRVYPGFLQLAGFMSMNPGRHLGSHFDFFHHLVKGDGDSAQAHRAFYDEYLSVMDLNADFYLQTLDLVFQRHALPNRTLTHRNQLVDLRAICKTALHTIEGELDDISGVGQTKAAHDLCSSIPDSKRRHVVHPGVGHFGIFNGRRWRSEVYPQVRDFIAQHNQA
jgi:poly(3-hydroxybutyrate) depolymerase